LERLSVAITVACSVMRHRPACRVGDLVGWERDDGEGGGVHLLIRADFGYRDRLLRQFPATFSVPARYRKHVMVVADLASGDAGAIEDALEAAWRLQRSAG
jgi:hypothetical protein